MKKSTLKQIVPLLIAILLLSTLALVFFIGMKDLLQGGGLSTEDEKLQMELRTRLKELDASALVSDLFPYDWDMVCIFSGNAMPEDALKYLNISNAKNYNYNPKSRYIVDGYWGIALIKTEEQTVDWHEFYGPHFFFLSSPECLHKKSAPILQRYTSSNVNFIKMIGN